MPGTEDQQHHRERRFAALYQEHYRPILAYAVRRVAPAEDAADVVADVFTTAWRRIDQVPEAPADRLWLYGVAQRVIGGRRRSARRLLRLTARLRADAGTRPLSEPGPGRPGLAQSGLAQSGLAQSGLAQPGLRDATADHLLAALDQLTPGEREALQLVLWEQLSHAEAAQVLGCSANAVAIRVHRAKTRLRSELCRAGLPGTGPSGTGPSGTGPSGTGPSGADPSGTGPSGTETSSTRASSTRASSTRASSTRASSTRASSTRARIDRS